LRDTCRLRPNVPGVSPTIKEVSVLGRFLEHGRIYYFHNNGKPEYYLGSADAMQRNLEKRVEVLFPVEDARLQAELRYILDTQLADQRGAWDMQPDGSYTRRTGTGAKHSQQMLIERTERRLKEATRLRRRKVQAGRRK
jgi:polyphosphate kinase